MPEIKTDLKLNRAVAKAIVYRATIKIGPILYAGLDAKGQYDKVKAAEFIEMGADDERMLDALIPRYSTDLNEAFAAAECVWAEFAVRRCPAGTYYLSAFCDGEWSRFDDEYSTPALAICRAILATRR